MPTIYIVESIKVLIYFDDHFPAHFHVIYNEYEEIMEIGSLNTNRGMIRPKQRKKIMKWASNNKHFLVKKWNEFNPNNKI